MKFRIALMATVAMVQPASAQFSLISGSSCVAKTGGAGKAKDTGKAGKNHTYDYATLNKVSDSGATSAKVSPTDSAKSDAFIASGIDASHEAEAAVISTTQVKARSWAYGYGNASGDPSEGAGGSYESGGNSTIGGGTWSSLAEAQTAYKVNSGSSYKLKTTSWAKLHLNAYAVLGKSFGSAIVSNSGPGIAVHEVWGFMGEGTTNGYADPTVYTYAVYYDENNELQIVNGGLTDADGVAEETLVGYAQGTFSGDEITSGGNMARSASSTWVWGGSVQALSEEPTESISTSFGRTWGVATIEVQ